MALPDEKDRPEYERLIAALEAQYQPVTFSDGLLLRGVAHYRWCQRRIAGIKRLILSRQASLDPEQGRAQFTRLEYYDRLERRYDRNARRAGQNLTRLMGERRRRMEAEIAKEPNPGRAATGTERLVRLSAPVSSHFNAPDTRNSMKKSFLPTPIRLLQKPKKEMRSEPNIGQLRRSLFLFMRIHGPTSFSTSESLL
jgi:hypothetical protein